MDLLRQSSVSENEPKGPDDEGLKDLIDNMASKVAKYGITYEELMKKMVQDMKDRQDREPQDISFIEEGKPFNEYYRHEVYNVYIFYCQATRTGTGIGIGAWDWGQGMGNGEWGMEKWEIGNREYPSPRR